MPKVDIARALKDKDYFNSLSEAEKAQVRAADPSGDVEVSDDNLDSVSGGLIGGENVAPITGTGTSGSGTSLGTSFNTDVEPQNCNCNC